MTGPEHYAEAERLMSLAEMTDWTTPEAPYRVPAMAAAQVHATLAQTAALVEALGNSLGGSLLTDVPDPTEPFVTAPSPWAQVLR